VEGSGGSLIWGTISCFVWTDLEITGNTSLPGAQQETRFWIHLRFEAGFLSIPSQLMIMVVVIVMMKSV
jgi:hypothetical protein